MLVPSPEAPVPQRFGLLSTASVVEGVDTHELNGIEYLAVCSTQVDPYPVGPCPPETRPTKQPGQTISGFAASPFGLYAADECTLGRDETEARGQLRQRLLLGEQAAVERVIYDGRFGGTGDVVVSPNLRQQAHVIETPAAGADPADAVGALEHWLASTYGGAGVIHAPRWMAPQLHKAGAVTSVSGPRATTLLGSSVVFGTGYDGSPPVQEPALDDTHPWLYITPPITIRRSNIIEPASWTTGAFDRQQNRGLLLAERIYVVDWPCSVAAVKTNSTMFEPTAQIEEAPL
ncbi:hypothetical protein FB384_004961 [Prauserella sediminis]|uniref:Major capsid protein n=1 Tax=Prauserella sediminis TaxID=577680 RepID=A0A839XQA6_9PSEU|nr:hypothetical protein [Prauserella sediminis]MBB3666002.1 hypothetical protein [Prauserella sediminis]